MALAVVATTPSPGLRRWGALGLLAALWAVTLWDHSRRGVSDGGRAGRESA
jgi:hypothetical protein